MPSLKTECTELAVAFGILNREPLSVDPDELEALFEGTLTPEKFLDFCEEYANNRSGLYETLFCLGQNIRRQHSPFSATKSLSWSGPDKLAPSVSSSQDLLVLGSVPISVKVGSNVVYNLSPPNLFERVPCGQAFLSRGENWFLKCTGRELQELYAIPAQMLRELPESVEEFESKASREVRDRLKQTIRNLWGEADYRFNEKYVKMCRRVAEVSAKLFNDYYAETAGSKARSSLTDDVIKVFFRVNSVPYLLAGIDHDRPFAVVVPGITSWKKNWALLSVNAQPDYNREQCVVNFQIECREKKTKEPMFFTFHSEVRWSHGKFCGNPEAKLYKEFKWLNVPFFEKLYSA